MSRGRSRRPSGQGSSRLSDVPASYFWQNALIFGPSREVRWTPADAGIAFEDLRLRCEDGVEIHGWWVRGPDGRPTVIFLHGSDGNIAYELSTLRFLITLGVSVLMVDYPGYGRSEGRPSERGCYAAAEAAWRFVSGVKGVRGENVVVFGQSLGSAVGAYLAGSRLCRGLVFQSGFTSVPDTAALVFPYLPVRLFCRTKMNSLARIARCRCPVLVLHSEMDEHIPFVHARRIYERAPEPKKLVRLAGFHDSRDWQLVAEVRAAWLELLAGRTDGWSRA